MTCDLSTLIERAAAEGIGGVRQAQAMAELIERVERMTMTERVVLKVALEMPERLG
jgi:hypothetical protein